MATTDLSIAFFRQAACVFGDAIVAEKRPAVRRFLRHSAAETNRELALRLAEVNRTEEAIRLLTSVHTAHQELEDPSGEAFALIYLARIQRQAGNLEGSLLFMKLAVTALAKLEDKRAAALLSWEEAALALEQGDLAGARPVFEQALKLFVAAGDRAGHAMCINAFGEVARRAGKYDEALGHYRLFLETMEKLGHPSAAASAHTNIGWTQLAMGHFDEAVRAFRAALARLGSDPDAGGERVACLLGLTCAHIGLGSPGGAKTAMAEASGLARPNLKLDSDSRGALDTIVRVSHEGEWEALAETTATLTRFVDRQLDS
jgi:tetratricopeptide (TPR) repeat protein